MRHCVHFGKPISEGNHEPIHACDEFGACTTEDFGMTSGGKSLAICKGCIKRTAPLECQNRNGLHETGNDGPEVYHCRPLRVCTLKDEGMTLRDGTPMPFCSVDCKSFFPFPKPPVRKCPFGAVFVINLKQRPKKLEAFLSRVPEVLKPATPWVAIHGDSIQVPEWWRAGNSAWGCYRSHLAILEHCYNEGLDSYAVFEDDAIFVPDFEERLLRYVSELPGDWQQAYLGGQLLHEVAHPPKWETKRTLKPWNVNRTHAFAIHRRAYAELYRHLATTPFPPNADGTPSHVDHHLGHIHEKGEFKAFVPDRWLCGQAAGKSDISGNTNPEMWWPDPETVAIRLTPPKCQRHLIYHIWPRKTENQTWRWNVGELVARLEQFDGVRTIGVALSDDAESLDAVKAAFAGHRIDNWIEVPNHPQLGELATFSKMLETLPKTGQTFYGHAKGVRHDNFVIREWARLMYRLNLDFPDRVDEALESHLTAGAFVKSNEQNIVSKNNWFYAGTFFWFQNQFLTEPREPLPNYYGVETWLGEHLPRSESFDLCSIETSYIWMESELEKARKWIGSDLMPKLSVPLVFLKAPLAVAQQLDARGWHRGHQKNESGCDRGVDAAAKSFRPADGLLEWWGFVSRESASENKRCICLYHPSLTDEQVRDIRFAAVNTIEAITVEEAEEKLEPISGPIVDEWLRCPHRKEELRESLNCNCGVDRSFYRCEIHGKCVKKLPPATDRSKFNNLDGVSICENCLTVKKVKIPIYINARNLLTPLRKMVEYLSTIPEARPIIIDNDSTWQPLLDWYDCECNVEVIRTVVNGGKFGWAPHMLDHEKEGIPKYVVTDSDLDLEGIPTDLLSVLSAGLDEYPVSKVGLSLDIESIPDDYPFAEQVRSWERQFWGNRSGAFHRAAIDTTFAMRRAKDPVAFETHGHLRAHRPYCSSHWPWHWTPSLIESNEEIRHYIETATTAGNHWTPKLRELAVG